MKKFLLLCVCAFICQFVNAQVELGHNEKYGVHFPYNLQPSELDIKNTISEVSYVNYELDYKFGELETGVKIGTALYQYDSQGRLIKFQRRGDGWNWYWTDGYDWDIQYDANGNIISRSHIYDNGKLSKVIYDDCVYRIFYINGSLSKVTKYYSDGDELFSLTFQNGDIIKKTSPPLYRGDNVRVRTYTYNNHKMLKGDGVTYTYNPKGLVSRMVEQGVVYDYTYEYDTKGNWVKRTRVNKDKNGYIKDGVLTVRTITYQ